MLPDGVGATVNEVVTLTFDANVSSAASNQLEQVLLPVTRQVLATHNCRGGQTLSICN